MKGLSTLIAGLLVVLYSTVNAMAATNEPLSSPVQGFDKVQSLKNATLEHTESKTVQRYLLPLGAMIKINGKWRSKKHDILTGELTRTTYLLKDDETFEELRNLDGNLSLNELYQYYFKQLKEQPANMLFECRGRNCGSSNQWGNGFVDNKRMVGRDRDQAYLAAKLTSDSAVSFVAIYMVKNATGETRVHIDSLSKPLEKTAKILSSAHIEKESGRILIIPANQINQPDIVNLVKTTLNGLKGDKEIYFIGHAYGDATVESLKKMSLEYAKQLKQVFNDGKENTGSKILIEGLGPLAPEGEGEDQLDRVELILH